MDDRPEKDQAEFLLRIESEGICFEKKIDRLTANYIMGMSLGLFRTPKAKRIIRNSGNVEVPPDACINPALREFVNGHKAKRFPDKVLTIAVYLLRHHDPPFEYITRNRISRGLKDAGIEKPSNLARDLRWAISNGWMAPMVEGDTSLSRLIVTQSGYSAVEDCFSEEVLKNTKQPRGGES